MLLQKIASVLALIIGVMAIRVSAKAMRGWQPGWKVAPWLPVYNFVMGILSLVPAALLWFNHPYALITSLITFGIHGIVLLLLLTVFRGKVAKQSIGAISFRAITWIAILILLWL
jgi:hypothetical protein